MEKEILSSSVEVHLCGKSTFYDFIFVFYFTLICSNMAFLMILISHIFDQITL